jgi:hypothetical protein
VDAAERAAVEKLAGSRKAEARLVERAAIVWRSCGAACKASLPEPSPLT